MNAILQKAIPFIASGVIALGAYLTGAVTDVGQATQVALDKDKAVAQCRELVLGKVE